MPRSSGLRRQLWRKRGSRSKKKSSESTSDRTARDETIAEKYSGKPSPRALSQSGQIDRQASERAERVRRRDRRRGRSAN